MRLQYLGQFCAIYFIWLCIHLDGVLYEGPISKCTYIYSELRKKDILEIRGVSVCTTFSGL